MPGVAEGLSSGDPQGYTARMFQKMKNIVTSPSSDASPANFAKAESDVKSIISDIYRFAPKNTDHLYEGGRGAIINIFV